MNDIGIAGILIIIANVITSLSAFQNRNIFNSFSFDVGEILGKKDYKRMFSSGFIHLDYAHLIMNMLSFYFFAGIVESLLGTIPFFMVYFGSLLAGNFLSLWINKSNSFYRAVGASGAVSGIIFAALVIDPGMEILLFFAIPLPGWAFALGFVAYSIFGMRNKRDNIGHDAHLGGAIFGLFLALYFKPSMLFENTLPIILAGVPSLIYLALLIFGIDLGKPNSLKIKIPKKTEKPEYYDVEDYYREKKKNKEIELNRLLEKVGSTGIDSLSKKEKENLDELSK